MQLTFPFVKPTRRRYPRSVSQQRVVVALQEHPELRVDRKRLASHLGISYVHLHRLLRELKASGVVRSVCERHHFGRRYPNGFWHVKSYLELSNFQDDRLPLVE